MSATVGDTKGESTGGGVCGRSATLVEHVTPHLSGIGFIGGEANGDGVPVLVVAEETSTDKFKSEPSGLLSGVAAGDSTYTALSGVPFGMDLDT